MTTPSTSTPICTALALRAQLDQESRRPTIHPAPATLDGRPLELSGVAVSRWRERIGNAVPVQAAEAIAGQMLVALIEASMGSFSLQAGQVWVAPEVTPC